MDMTASWIDEFPGRIAELDRTLLRRRRRVVVPEGGARMQVDGQSMIAFCSNDYLGLARHPALVQAACAAAREFGVGSGASPLVSGHSAANESLEHELPAFTQLPRALYFYAGYAANIGIVPALVGEGDALFMATLGKAAGVAGAFVAGDDALVEWLLQKTRRYVFATAAPPLLASALRASLRLIEAGQSRRDHLQKLIAQLRAGLLARLRGTTWRLAESSTAVQAVIIGANDEALGVMDGLQRRGLWVPAIRPPTVPEGTARLRIALSAAHSEADVDRLVQALAELAPATAAIATAAIDNPFHVNPRRTNHVHQI
jgi:7-keto-8-aminopelargonate synthetase-like enzyme